MISNTKQGSNLLKGQKNGNIYMKTAAVVKKKGLKRMTLKEIAAIVHESRRLSP